MYSETKNKFQNLYQPVKAIDHNQNLKEFSIKDIGRIMDGTYRLNASHYNGLRDDKKEYPYGTQVFYPQSFPNHFYNTYKFSPAFLAWQQNSLLFSHKYNKWIINYL